MVHRDIFVEKIIFFLNITKVFLKEIWNNLNSNNYMLDWEKHCGAKSNGGLQILEIETDY